MIGSLWKLFYHLWTGISVKFWKSSGSLSAL